MSNETVTLRKIGGGPLILTSWRDHEKKPVFTEETKDMTPELKARVIRYKSGLPIGKLDLTNPKVISRSETELIEQIKSHPLCEQNPKRRGKPMFMIVDHIAAQKQEEALADKLIELQGVIMRASDIDLDDVCIVAGINGSKAHPSKMRLAIQNKYNKSASDVDSFIGLFDIKKSKGDVSSVTLKEHISVEALLRRAANAKVIKTKGINITYKDEPLGRSYSEAAMNLLNTTGSGLSQLLPSIKSDFADSK